ncbi:ABC transporter ATP-binding protein [Microlunatus soli]|nr:ABC transporter ATP-binding protein [Microlunatus soli]
MCAEVAVSRSRRVSPSSDLSFRSAIAVAARTARRGLRDAAGQARRWFLVAGLLTLVHALVPPAEVWLLKALLEQVDSPSPQDARLAITLAGLTIVVGLNFSLGYLALSASQRTGFRLAHHYRSRLAAAAAGLHPRQLAEAATNTRLQAAALAVDRMTRVPGDTLQLVGTALTSIGLCAAIFGFSAAAGILVLSALLPTVLAMTFIARSESVGWPPIAAVERRSTYAMEQLVQQRTGSELALLGSGHKVASLVSQTQRQKMIMLDRLIAIDMRWESAASAATALLLAAALVSMIITDVGAALAAAAVAGILSGLSAIRFTGFAFGNIVSTAPQAEAYAAVVGTAEPDDPTSGPATVGRLTAEAVSVSYPDAAGWAVRDVSLTVEKGEVIALVGANGAGKTTTVNAILGVVERQSGTIMIDGISADDLTHADLLSRIGLLTQEFGRYEFRVRDVVALGRSAGEVADEELWSALRSVGLAELVASMPDGLDTQLGQQWGGVGLSGGQWQRLALARIHLRDAGIWILDEPTSAVDAEAEREIFAELQRTKGNRITIVVSHRAWTLKGMDRIYVFDRGRVVQVGSYDELLSRAGRFADLFAEQLSG